MLNLHSSQGLSQPEPVQTQCNYFLYFSLPNAPTQEFPTPTSSNDMELLAILCIHHFYSFSFLYLNCPIPLQSAYPSCKLLLTLEDSLLSTASLTSPGRFKHSSSFAWSFCSLPLYLLQNNDPTNLKLLVTEVFWG